MITTTAYAAVRKSIEGDYEWIDRNKISYSSDHVQYLIKIEGEKIPAYYAAHPLMRIAQVEIREV